MWLEVTWAAERFHFNNQNKGHKFIVASNGASSLPCQPCKMENEVSELLCKISRPTFCGNVVVEFCKTTLWFTMKPFFPYIGWTTMGCTMYEKNRGYYKYIQQRYDDGKICIR